MFLYIEDNYFFRLFSSWLIFKNILMFEIFSFYINSVNEFRQINYSIINREEIQVINYCRDKIQVANYGSRLKAPRH